MLLSFERPAASPAGAFSADLENCTAMPTSASMRKHGRRPCLWARLRTSPGEAGVTGITARPVRRMRDHRQDMKGTRWMPRHQESMKGVNGCDKPRGGAE